MVFKYIMEVKMINCWFCGSDKLNIELIMANKPKRPHFAISCSECKEPLMSTEVTKDFIGLLKMGLDIRAKD